MSCLRGKYSPQFSVTVSRKWEPQQFCVINAQVTEVRKWQRWPVRSGAGRCEQGEEQVKEGLGWAY